MQPCTLLASETGFDICEEADNGRDAVARAIQTKPQVAVLDIGLPVLNGIDTTRRIRGALPVTEVLIFSMHDSERIVCEALSAGARSYVVTQPIDFKAANDAAAMATPVTSMVTEVWQLAWSSTPEERRGDPPRPSARSPRSISDPIALS
jgi:DNA-binding NarL/FixJ family response regulator